MSLSDDPLNNASPTTRQRFESALARRRSRESQFRVVIPPAAIQHMEAKAHQVQGGENQAWVQWEYGPEEWAHFDQSWPASGESIERVRDRLTWLPDQREAKPGRPMPPDYS